MQKQKKKRSALKTLGKVLLVLILTVGVLAGLLVAYLQFMGFQYDSEADRSAAPMPAANRWDAEGDTLICRCDKADLYWAMGYAGLDIAEIEQDIAPYSIKLENYGLYIEDGGVAVTARLLWKDLLPLPLRAQADVSVSDGTVTFTLRELRLGQWLKLPLKTLARLAGLEAVPDWSVDLRIFSRDAVYIESIAAKDGVLELRIPAGDWLWREAEGTAAELTMLSLFTGEEAPKLVLKALEGDAEPLLSGLKNYTELRKKVLMNSPFSGVNAFLTGRNADYMARFLPELDSVAVGAVANDNRALLHDRKEALTTLLETLANRFREGWSVAEGGMRDPYTWTVYPLSEAMGPFMTDCTSCFDTATAKLALITGEGAASRGMPLLSKLYPGAEGLDGKAPYGVGVVAYAADGTPALFYLEYYEYLMCQPLTEDELPALEGGLPFVFDRECTFIPKDAT